MAKNEDWPWTPIEVTCDSCGAANTIHEHPEEMLAELAPHGVKWECNACGAANWYGAREAAPAPSATLDGVTVVSSSDAGSGAQS